MSTSHPDPHAEATDAKKRNSEEVMQSDSPRLRRSVQFFFEAGPIDTLISVDNQDFGIEIRHLARDRPLFLCSREQGEPGTSRSRFARSEIPG